MMLKDLLESIRWDIGYELANGSRLPKFILFLQVAAIQLHRLAQSLACRHYGHKIVDDSYAGPDNGNMDHHCSRCGASWDVPLY